MPARAAAPSPHSPPPFAFVGGDPSLDLLNTVDWTAAGLRDERLPTYDRFARWAEAAGVVGRGAGGRLRRAARRHPRRAAEALARVHQFRGALHRVVAALATRSRAPVPVEPLNRYLAEALDHLELSGGPAHARLGWRDLDRDLLGPLHPVVWSAARLLDSAEADRIRVCGGPDCGWAYVDRSRNGLRRWCAMETCGTRAKSRRRAARRATASRQAHAPRLRAGA
jgi:predicted RNA-binding Zn ribbon-like protein